MNEDEFPFFPMISGFGHSEAGDEMYPKMDGV